MQCRVLQLLLRGYVIKKSGRFQNGYQCDPPNLLSNSAQMTVTLESWLGSLSTKGLYCCSRSRNDYQPVSAQCSLLNTSISKKTTHLTPVLQRSGLEPTRKPPDAGEPLTNAHCAAPRMPLCV
ncbi:hypothetical protein FKM82_003149 [Ascaphus truei]